MCEAKLQWNLDPERTREPESFSHLLCSRPPLVRSGPSWTFRGWIDWTPHLRCALLGMSELIRGGEALLQLGVALPVERQLLLGFFQQVTCNRSKRHQDPLEAEGTLVKKETWFLTQNPMPWVKSKRKTQHVGI